MRRNPASRSSSASSATIMSAAPSSSRPSRSAQLGVRLKHNANRAVVEGQAHRAGRRFHRARHHLDQDRADDARCRRHRSAFPHRLARRSRIRIITASTRRSATSCSPPPTTSKEMRAIHRRGFARLPVGRGHLPRDGLREARSAAAAIHRPLLHRRISDAAHRPRRGSDRRGNCRCSRKPSWIPARSHRKPLAGRIALVTGASRGIGHAAALALAAAGAHVVAVARTVGGLEELDDEIKRPAARRPWCRSTSRTTTASSGSAPRCTSATASSTS